MKRICNIFIVTAALSATMFLVTSCASNQQFEAPTTVEHFESTQARALDITANGFVKPLGVDLSVDEAAGMQLWISEPISKKFYEGAMQNNINNIRSWGAFQATVKWGCDVVVAPTFHFFTDRQGNYILEVRGYKGNFKNWKPASEADMKLVAKSKLLALPVQVKQESTADTKAPEVKPAETPKAQKAQTANAAAAGAAFGAALGGLMRH